MSLEDQLFDLVFVYEAGFERAAQQSGVSGAQACLLMQLARASRTMGQLASDLLCDASNVTQLVGRLERRGYVVREPDPDDRRARRVSVTAAGRAVSRAVEEHFTLPSERLGRLSAAERDQISGLLSKAFGSPPSGGRRTGEESADAMRR